LQVKSGPIRDLKWPRGFQEIKMPRFRDNGTGWWQFVSLTHPLGHTELVTGSLYLVLLILYKFGMKEIHFLFFEKTKRMD
jgi:hypothetical protein